VASEIFADLVFQVKEMSINILRYRLMIFVYLLVFLFGLFGCAQILSSRNQEQEPKNNERIFSHRLILTTEIGHAESTLACERSIEAPSYREGQEIYVDFASIIGRGPQYFGVEYGWIDQDEKLFLERYRRLHGNVVRVQISHKFFEPRNDNNDPDYSEIDFSRTVSIDKQMGKTMTYEKMFKALASAFPDMHFQINIWLCARWNATKTDGYLGIGGAFPPKDYAEHREFIRELARWLVGDCGIPPDHLSFTFINEPNLKGFFVGSQKDLLRMAQETRFALDEVSSLIQMGGLDEVHGTSWTDQFYRELSGRCCDMWTFHVYERGLPAMWKSLRKRTSHLKKYGPVWVTEFADMSNGSPDAKMDFSTREAALGFAELLGRLWPSGIAGIIHFRLSDTYIDRHNGLVGNWIGHGLFADARGIHSDGQMYEPFPIFWVFANMYREIGGGEIVKTVSTNGLTVIGARKVNGDVKLSVWLTNSTKKRQTLILKVSNLPFTKGLLQIFDNLISDKPIGTKAINEGELNIFLDISQKSSYLFVFRSL
jgi:hypothetical protein